MKNILAIMFICTSTYLAFSQNIGVGVSNPSQMLDVGGWIEVGNQSQGTTATSGTIRYNTSVSKMQFYNGSTWVSMGGTFTTFIRWGRDDCPSTASLVYWGYAGSKAYNHSGSGINHLCLTNSPAFTGYNDGNQNGALVYGTEFQTSGYGISTLVNRHDYDARCAVCRVTDASATIMVPGTVSCPSGWTRQYWGYIMATHYTQQKSSFVCVDNAPDISGSHANNDGALWYPTETEPGGFDFTPYVSNRETTCTVCTK